MKKFPFDQEKSHWSLFISISLFLYLLASFISISLSQIFISIAFLFFLLSLILEKKKIEFPFFFWLLIAYAALSLVSCSLSKNPETSFWDSRELLLFLIVPIVYRGFQRQETIKTANFALLVSGLLSCLYSLLYFIFSSNYGERLKGFMGHYMTQAGLLLLFSCLTLSMFLFIREKIRFLWGVGFIFSLISLTMTLTRSAWVGLIVAVFLILLLYNPKLLIVMPVVAGLFFFASPQRIKNRALSIFSPRDASNKERLEYIKGGIKVIKDYPLFGTGPNTVNVVIKSKRYGLSRSAQEDAVHLHNNLLQIGAERGIPALFVWIAWLAWTFISLVRLLRNKDPSLRALTVASLAAIVALFSAGLFEYNFGDSEVITLFLYMITVPFSLHQIRRKAREEK